MTTTSKYMYCKRFKVYVSSSAIQLNRVEWVDSRHLSLRPLLLPLLSARDQEWRGVIVYIYTNIQYIKITGLATTFSNI
jgi:hypothetical protein